MSEGIVFDHLTAHLAKDYSPEEFDTRAFYALFLRRRIKIYDALKGGVLKEMIPPDSHGLLEPMIELAFRSSEEPIYCEEFRFLTVTEGHNDAIVPLPAQSRGSGNGPKSAPSRH